MTRARKAVGYDSYRAHERPMVQWRVLLVLLAAIVVGILLIGRASAEDPRLAHCLPSQIIKQILAAAFHEEPIIRGITTTGYMVEIWASADGSTWTALVSSADGKSCITASGEELEIRIHSANLGSPS
jgi:hypothetical protein